MLYIYDFIYFMSLANFKILMWQPKLGVPSILHCSYG